MARGIPKPGPRTPINCARCSLFNISHQQTALGPGDLSWFPRTGSALAAWLRPIAITSLAEYSAVGTCPLANVTLKCLLVAWCCGILASLGVVFAGVMSGRSTAIHAALSESTLHSSRLFSCSPRVGGEVWMPCCRVSGKGMKTRAHAYTVLCSSQLLIPIFLSSHG